METQQRVIFCIAELRSCCQQYKMFLGVHVKYPVFLAGRQQIWIFSADFNKRLHYEMSWKLLILSGLCRTVKLRLLNERCKFWCTGTRYDRLPFLLYGSECWTLTQQQIKRILWSEMRFLRPVEGYSITQEKERNKRVQLNTRNEIIQTEYL